MCHLILMMPLLGIGLFYVLPMAWALPLYGVVLVVSAILYGLIYRAHRQPVASGKESMLGREVVAVGGFEIQGWVRYQNVLWKVRSQEPLAAGDRATIVGMHGMTLLVQRARSGESGVKSCGCQTTCSCQEKRMAHVVPAGLEHREETS
ncbi:MAG: NfeD family protein [bacterium]|nr:NfeD family protein [bacterium]